MLTDLKTAKKVTGAKQVTRALKNGTARRVFLAENADPRVTEPVADLCRETGTETEQVPTMAALGAACGIPGRHGRPPLVEGLDHRGLRHFQQQVLRHFPGQVL